MNGPGNTRTAKARFEQREGTSRHLHELEQRVKRLADRVERGRIYEASIAGSNAALQAELERAQAELARLDRRAAG